MKHFLFFSCFFIASSLFSTDEYIDGAFLSEIEKQYKMVTQKIFQDFLTKYKEEDKYHHESLLEEKKERSFLNHYNKKIDRLAELLQKKIKKINFIYEQEIDKEKETFTEKYGIAKIVKVHYKKTYIQASHKKRVSMLLASLDKVYEQVVKLHNQLEKKINSFYLLRLQNELKENYQRTIKAIKEPNRLFENALVKENRLDS